MLLRDERLAPLLKHEGIVEVNDDRYLSGKYFLLLRNVPWHGSNGGSVRGHSGKSSLCLPALVTSGWRVIRPTGTVTFYHFDKVANLLFGDNEAFTAVLFKGLLNVSDDLLFRPC